MKKSKKLLAAEEVRQARKQQIQLPPVLHRQRKQEPQQRLIWLLNRMKMSL